MFRAQDSRHRVATNCNSKVQIKTRRFCVDQQKPPPSIFISYTVYRVIQYSTYLGQIKHTTAIIHHIALNNKWVMFLTVKYLCGKPCTTTTTRTKKKEVASRRSLLLSRGKLPSADRNRTGCVVGEAEENSSKSYYWDGASSQATSGMAASPPVTSTSSYFWKEDHSSNNFTTNASRSSTTSFTTAVRGSSCLCCCASQEYTTTKTVMSCCCSTSPEATTTTISAHYDDGNNPVSSRENKLLRAQRNSDRAMKLLEHMEEQAEISQMFHGGRLSSSLSSLILPSSQETINPSLDSTITSWSARGAGRTRNTPTLTPDPKAL
jgi:hypothetical protein